jgi:hypothetical protein
MDREPEEVVTRVDRYIPKNSNAIVIPSELIRQNCRY